MSRMNLLIASDIPGGAVIDERSDAALNEVIAEAQGCIVPVFWLALFDGGDFTIVDASAVTEDGDETFRIPSLVAETDAARRRFRERRGLLSARFPEFESAWERFDAFLHQLEARFLKVDVSEGWDEARISFEEESFEECLRSAVDWFEDRGEDEFEQLLNAAGILDYDFAKRSFNDRPPYPGREYYLHGSHSPGASTPDAADS